MPDWWESIEANEPEPEHVCTPEGHCSYRGCATPPKWRIVPPTYTRANLQACDAHLAGFVESQKYGVGMGASADVIEIEG